LIKSLTQAKPLLEPGANEQRLRPAEIAYLVRRGDRVHALLVLGADILQRVIKSQISDQPVPPQAEYERQAFAMAKEQVSDWARGWAARQAGVLIPPDARKDPVGFAKGISRTYTFFAVTVRSFVAKTLKDPWQIRNYISLPGVARLILSLSMAGYQDALEDGIRQELLERGLLVAPARRLEVSRLLYALGFLAVGGAIALAAIFIHPVLVACAAAISAALLAACLHATLLVRRLIPLYMELNDVISSIGRGGFRLTAVRWALALVTTLCRVSSIFACAIVGGLIFLIMHFLFRVTTDVIWMTYLLAVPIFSAMSTILEAWRFWAEDQPSTRAEAELELLRKKLAPVKAMDSIRNVLLSPEYDETFSELLALYGVESLLMIV